MGIIGRALTAALRGLGKDNGIQRLEDVAPPATQDVYLVPAPDRRRRPAEDFRGDVDSEGGTIGQ